MRRPNLGSLRIMCLGSTLLLSRGALAEALFTLPSEAKSESKNVSQIIAESRSSGFWSRYGEGCSDQFTKGFSSGESLRPKDQLAALQKFDACIAAAKAQLLAQADTTEKLMAADALVNVWTTKATVAKIEEGGKAEFLGISFGVGVGVSYSEDDVISKAELGPGNVIISTEDNKTLPRVIFESHYYGFCKKDCHGGRRGVGPYFGIVAKTDKLISAFSTGVMFGWKDDTPGDHGGFSVGLGVLIDDDVKSLAEGFEEGEPLPAGEPTIRFEEKSRWSALLFFTRTF